MDKILMARARMLESDVWVTGYPVVHSWASRLGMVDDAYNHDEKYTRKRVLLWNDEWTNLDDDHPTIEVDPATLSYITSPNDKERISPHPPQEHPMRTPDPDIVRQEYYGVESEEEMIEWLLEALLYFSIAKAIHGHFLVELQGTQGSSGWVPNFTDWGVVEPNERGLPSPFRKVTTPEYIQGITIGLDLLSKLVKKLSNLQKERTFSR